MLFKLFKPRPDQAPFASVREGVKGRLHVTLNYNGLFPLLDSDSDSNSDTESCTMQDFTIGSDSDSDPLTEMYVIGTEICLWDGDLSLK